VHLVRRTALAEGIAALTDKPVLHGDNGSTLKATTVLAMLNWLGVKPSYSRPRVRAMTTAASAQHRVDTHPLRLRRYLLSDKNPLLSQLAPAAEQVRASRNNVSPDNSYLQMEGVWVGALHDSVNLYRDLRDGMVETMFNLVYASPLMRAIGAAEPGRISETPRADLCSTADVRQALEQIDQVGYADAVIRMLILLAHARKGVRRDCLERSNDLLNEQLPISALGVATRNLIIHQQSLTVEFEPAQALATLPRLLPDVGERVRALAACDYVLGDAQDMNDETRDMFGQILAVLEIQTAHTELKPKAALLAR
jgi:hypothetical protein